MKVLLTGATGYLGSELALELRTQGHEIWCLTRRPVEIPGIEIDRHVMHDLQQPIGLASEPFDLVIHAAGANDVASRDPLTALAMTTLSARHVAEFASRQRDPTLVYVSTFQVYGCDEGEVSERTPCAPRNDYALTHLFAEQWIEQFGRTHGLRWLVVRPANIAGVPRAGAMSRWTLAPGCFCQDAMREQCVVVRSTGNQYRDFLPLADVARQVVDVSGEFDRFAGQALNICAGVSLTIREVAELAVERYKALFRQSCDLQFRPAPGATVNTPAPLIVRSTYQDRRPNECLSHAAATARMIECIDRTYQLLERTA